MRHACLATWPDRTIRGKVYYGFGAGEQRNVMGITPMEQPK